MIQETLSLCLAQLSPSLLLLCVCLCLSVCVCVYVCVCLIDKDPDFFGDPSMSNSDRSEIGYEQKNIHISPHHACPVLTIL